MTTDLERRLTEALADAAPDLPSTGLAEGARLRARRRRRGRASAVAALTVLAVSVPTVLAWDAREAGPTGGDVAADPPGEDAVPPGWQRVARRGLEMYVPGTWREGGRRTWCGASDEPRHGLIESPATEGFQAAIACTQPVESFGVTVSYDASTSYRVHPSGSVRRYAVGPAYVEGSWLGSWYDEERVVSVNAGDAATVKRILATVCPID